MTRNSTPPSLILAALVSAALLAGCGSTPLSPTPAGSPDAGLRAVTEAAPSDVSSSTAETADPAVQALIDELTITSQGDAAASGYLVSVARRLLDEARFEDAESKLRHAVDLDPDNDEARRLLRQVGFMLGVRPDEIRLVAEEFGDAERVRRQVRVRDLQRWLGEGEQLLAEGEAEEAQRRFQRVLDHLEWLEQSGQGAPARQILSTLQAEAQAGRTSAGER